MRIRPETEADRSAIRAVNEAAFKTSIEADIIEALRARPTEVLSLVADSDDAAVGHILFSQVTLADHPKLKLFGLGPMAVVPRFQRSGVGSALVREGLAQCRQRGVDAVVVLGHPEYYPRFGFVPASRHAIRSEYDVPENVFMIVELKPRALDGVSGLVRYDEAFGSA
jgi:putative acetyltransferase